MDHLVPVAAGGTTTDDNVVLSCYGCNRRKGDHISPTEFDIHGVRIIDPSRTCPVHNPIKASCPHSFSLTPHADDPNLTPQARALARR